MIDSIEVLKNTLIRDYGEEEAKTVLKMIASLEEKAKKFERLRKCADAMAHEIEEHYATNGIYCNGDMPLAKYKADFPRKED